MNKKEQLNQLLSAINTINTITILARDSETVSGIKQTILNVYAQIQNEIQQEQESKQKQNTSQSK